MTAVKTQPILEEAMVAVSGERQKNYGSPRKNFERCASLWNAWLKAKYEGTVLGQEREPDKDAVDIICHLPELTAQDYAAMMRLCKEARLMNGYHRDSVVDIAGYAQCDQRVEEDW